MNGLKLLIGVFLATALTLGAPRADYSSGFEGLDASPGGTILTGQDGYYLPPGVESTDFLVYTYMDNMLELPPNPEGGDQFIAGTGPAGGVYARAQRDHDFTTDAEWTLTYDFCAAFLGAGESAQNLGSFSVRNEDAGVTSYIHLMTWVDPADPTTFNAFFMGYDAAGSQFPQPGESPGPAWEGLSTLHWYRAYTVINLDTNEITEVGIIDLDTMEESSYEPTGWYLEGGSGGASAPPASFRFFAGGSVEGNTLAFDNIDIAPGMPVPVHDTSWGGMKALFR